MLVPFGGRFQTFNYMLLWAKLGVRNPWQAGLPAKTVALRNTQFAKTGASHPTSTGWRLWSEGAFGRVIWAERHFVEASRDVSRVSRLAAPWVRLPVVQLLYRTFHVRVLTLQSSRPSPIAPLDASQA